MVVVSISETYDLSTKVNKMTLIGVHTPVKELIQKTYPGLCMNYKYFRILKVDCVLATAQQLPLSVGEIGLDTSKIRPQDIMNPILYKAVSNDSWSTLEARLMALNSGDHSFSVSGNMAFAEADDVTLLDDEHRVYYSLLSNRDGFRTAPVQAGVQMKGLVPLVFDKWYTNGQNGCTVGSGSTASETDESASVIADVNNALVLQQQFPLSMRGRPHPMPRINTTYLTAVSGNATGNKYEPKQNGMSNGAPLNCQTQMPPIPPVMLGCIILPPATATTGIIYYRMVTRAYIEFTDARPIQEITSFAQMDSIYADLVYHSDYVEQSSRMDVTTDMVDVKNADIQKIMEGR